MKHLVFLLCGVAVLEGVQGWIFPSRCPPSLIPAKDCPTKKYTCIRNADCDEGEICCLDRCGRACKSPVPTVRGFCPKKPPQSASPRICPAVVSICRTDKDCRQGQKCCTADGCFYACVTPVSRKPRQGVCPRRWAWYRCRRTYNQCDIDNQCPRDQKCCRGSCGRKCTKPVTRKPGYCPKKAPSIPPLICPAVVDKCKNDQDCGQGLKCCSDDGCFSRCVRAVSGKPRAGTCPSYDKNIRCFRLDNQCDVDNQCPKGQKCCQGPCGRQCRPIVVNQVPGTCPPPSELIGTCDFNPGRGDCLRHSDCASRGQLCCSEGCGKRCKNPVGGVKPAPKTGYCPKKAPSIPPLICPAVVSKCKNDQNCGQGLKCCSDDGCFSRCVRPVSGRPRPGICPSYDKTIRCFRLDNKCDVDNQCPKGQKCCQAPCGRQCQPTVVNQVPGTCPPPSGRISTCDFNPARGDCIRHSECASRGQLCCREGCGKRCKNPVGGVKPVPPNESCPPVNKDIRCIAFINQCGDDKKCGRGLICCPGQCGRECKRPIIVRPGTCPKPPNPAVVLCSAPITDKCSSDTDCNAPEKCCPHPCGRFCRNPFKSGGLPDLLSQS